MKRSIIGLLLIVPALSFGQYNGGLSQEILLGRQPSARAEAMGRAYVSIDGDLVISYFNPAGMATLKGLELHSSYATPYYMLPEASYSYIGLGYKLNDYLIFGFNANHFTFGQSLTLIDINANKLGTYTPNATNYCFTLASQPLRNFYVGLNTNYLVWRLWDEQLTGFYFDLGVIKKFQFLQRATSGQSINVGASVVNGTSGTITGKWNGNTVSNTLPVIGKFGANYQFYLDKHLLIDTLKTLQFLVQGEYQDLFNSDYQNAIRTGCEVVFLELLAVRAGYYKETEDDYGFSGNYDELSAFTYGFGLQVPLYKLTKIPLNVNLDYTSLPQPPYSDFRPNFENFTTLNLKVSWMLKYKNAKG